MDHMTALVSCFARAYHYKNSERHVFADSLAEQMLTAEEYNAISQNMTQGIQFFMPGFHGTQEEALQFIVNHQLAPSVLARSVFCERAIGNAVRLNCRQIVIYACGYDTFSLRTDNQALTVYELDRPEMIADRWKRIARTGLEPACHVEDIGCDLSQPSWKEKLIRAGFDAKKISFGSLLGISYYLSKLDFRNFIDAIASIFCKGSSVCFDYPVSEAGAESRRSRELAAAAGEMMKATYSYEEMEALLSNEEWLNELTENMILWAKDKLGSGEYAGWCLSFIEDALEKSSGIEIFGGDSAKESALLYADDMRQGPPERGAFVFYDCICQGPDGPVNWGHCGISLGDGRIIHAWDEVRIDDYREIEAMTALSGDHPKYIGWVPVERVLKQKKYS